MCARYHIDEDVRDEHLHELIQRAAHNADKLGVHMLTSGDIHPQDIAPVLAPSALHRTLGAFPMKWGFKHPRRDLLVFNTRSETATEKDLFVTSVDDRRCLIPASYYYEWHKAPDGSKDKYAFYAENGNPLFLAGLYVRTNDRRQLPCFSVLTQDATPNIKHIHLRMPVLIPFSRAEEWLSPDTDFYEMINNLIVEVNPVNCMDGKE